MTSVPETKVDEKARTTWSALADRIGQVLLIVSDVRDVARALRDEMYGSSPSEVCEAKKAHAGAVGAAYAGLSDMEDALRHALQDIQAVRFEDSELGKQKVDKLAR